MAEDVRQSLEDMIRKFATDLDLPRVDVDKLIEMHERNLDSIVQTAVAAAQSIKATAATERDAVETAMNDALAVAGAMKPNAEAKELLSRESEAVGHSIEKVMAMTATIVEQTYKLNKAMLEMFLGRLAGSVHEIGESVHPADHHDEPKG